MRFTPAPDELIKHQIADNQDFLIFETANNGDHALKAHQRSVYYGVSDTLASK